MSQRNQQSNEMSNPSPSQSVGTVKCANCGNVSDARLPFCAYCGRPLGATPPTYAQAQQPTYSGGYAPSPQPEQPLPFVPNMPASVLARRGGSATRIILFSIIGFVVVILASVGILLAVIFAAVQPIMGTGDNFMAALRDGNYNAAFDLLTPELQNELRDARGLEEKIGGKQPATWDQRNFQVNDLSASGNYLVTLKSSERVNSTLSFKQVGDKWKVSYFSY